MNSGLKEHSNLRSIQQNSVNKAIYLFITKIGVKNHTLYFKNKHSHWLQVLGIICMSLASPALITSTHWFLFIVVTAFIATLLWCAIYFLGIREVLNLSVNWILTVSYYFPTKINRGYRNVIRRFCLFHLSSKLRKVIETKELLLNIYMFPSSFYE